MVMQCLPHHYRQLAVFGLGKSGVSVVMSLAESGIPVWVYDDNSALADHAVCKQDNIDFAHYTKWNWAKIDALILAPGIPLHFPEPHPVVLLARKHNCPIISDIELFYQESQVATYVGITGTNGKSTTAALLHHLLFQGKKHVQLGGNIGVPVMDLEPLGPEGVYVLELSSYQIDLLHKVHIAISVLLNITPDHIDRHGSMEGYIAAKKRIYSLQKPGDYAIIGVDTAPSLILFEQLQQEMPALNLIAISTTKRVAGGLSMIGNVLYDDREGEDKRGTAIERPYLPGDHNGQNIAAAIAVSSVLGVELEIILPHIASFRGLPHRLQWVANKQGVVFVNDSKATNAEAALPALKTYKNLYWIVGGRAKKEGIVPLVEFFSQVKHVYLIGESQDDFATLCEGKVPYSKMGDLKSAVVEAMKDAKGNEGATILLSPACASFDQWPSYEARGDAFCNYVDAL